jgi:hypothetical protein
MSESAGVPQSVQVIKLHPFSFVYLPLPSVYLLFPSLCLSVCPASTVYVELFSVDLYIVCSGILVVLVRRYRREGREELEPSFRRSATVEWSFVCDTVSKLRSALVCRLKVDWIWIPYDELAV